MSCCIITVPQRGGQLEASRIKLETSIVVGAGVCERSLTGQSWGFIMASPQLENGHIKIANELFEALICLEISRYERSVFDCVMRMTYGWNKKADWISLGQMSNITGIARSNIPRIIRSLVEKKMLIKNGKKLSIQKDWELWSVEWRKLPSKVTGVISPDNRGVITSDSRVLSPVIAEVLSPVIPTKDSKDIIQNTLATNVAKKDMLWTPKRSDDDADLPIIGDEEPVKKTKRDYLRVYKLFEEILGIKTPLNWLANTTQQKRAENLWMERGEKQIRSALRFYRDYKSEEFCPQITSPSDLDNKWEKLTVFKNKNL